MSNPGSAYMPYSGDSSYGTTGQQEGGSGQFSSGGQYESGNSGSGQQFNSSSMYRNEGDRYGGSGRYGEQYDSRYGYPYDRRNSFEGDNRRGSFSDRRTSMDQQQYGMNRKPGYEMGRRHSFQMNRNYMDRRGSYGMDRRGSFGMNRRESYSLDRQNYGMNRRDSYGMDRRGSYTRGSYSMDRKGSYDRRGSFDRFGGDNRQGRDFYNRYGDRFGRYGNQQFNQFDRDQFNGPRRDYFSGPGRDYFDCQRFDRDQFRDGQFGRYGRDQFRQHYNQFDDQFGRRDRFGGFGGFGSGFGPRGGPGQYGRSFGQRGFDGFNQQRQYGRNPFSFQNDSSMRSQYNRGSFDRRNSYDDRMYKSSFDNFGRRDSFFNQRRGSFDGRFGGRSYDNNQYRRHSYDYTPYRRYSMDDQQYQRNQYDCSPYRRYSMDNQQRRGSYDESPLYGRYGMKFGQMYGMQYYQQQMPAPIPPFSEPRSFYPNTMEHCYDEEDRYGRYRMSRAREMAVRANYNLLKRRYYERPADSSQNPNFHMESMGPHSAGIPADVLHVEFVDFRTLDNAKEHRTFNYEIVQAHDRPTPIYRRGQPFFINITFRDREFDVNRDNLFLNFYYGPNPSVPKKTRIVLPVTMQRDFNRAPNEWDVRVHNQDKRTMTLQVHIPPHCQVGMWFCVVETSKREVEMARLQYRCPEEIYVIFNPFCRDDTTYMENEAHRNEYVMSDTGKIFTGGFRSVKGRPWVFGQFDDCVLSAACVLLEMSHLTHSERGNPIKVARALCSMIQASGSNFDNSDGLIEPRYEDEFRGGQSPHGWTGSVQIIEEYLRGGASPVRFGHCWIMAGLMTTLCRALGLPARPVTAFVTAHDSQDSMTVDRYLDRFGDLLERGPGRDQPDSIWAYHTWCDVWMMRPDLPSDYSGWQGTDPSRSYRDYRDMFSGSCGPASSEAVRKGDVGCSDNTDAFYSCLNTYVRYYFEDEGSEWGFSPFRQYRYPVGRYILTKAIGQSDDDGEGDAEEITGLWRDVERTDADRFTVFNACRGFRNDALLYDYQPESVSRGTFPPMEKGGFDVSFELMEPVRVMCGQPLMINLQIHNNSKEVRTVQANISTRAMFYNGVFGPHLKRVTGQFTLNGGQSDMLTLRLDPAELQGKLVDQGFIKITSSGFVQETLHTYVDEYDFRFEKPKLEMEVAPECKVGQECQVNFMFQNPLDENLTDCFVTMEVGCSVRPRTIKVNRDVRPGEPFTFSHSFYPRRSGERKLVATFTSRQLQDVTGQCRIDIRE